MSKRIRDIYERLARAYADGRGVRLTGDEVQEFVEADDSISQVVDGILNPIDAESPTR